VLSLVVCAAFWSLGFVQGRMMKSVYAQENLSEEPAVTVMTFTPRPTPTSTPTPTGTPVPTETPMHLDLGQFADYGRYSGEQMYGMYIWLAEHPGWWNEDGDFTLDELLGLVLVRERFWHLAATDWIVEAAARQIWSDATPLGGHAPYCISTPCFYGVFNFLAAYSESAQHMAETYFGSGISWPQWEMQSSVMDDARAMGERVLHPRPEWTVYSNDLAYHWGNSDEWAARLVEAGQTPGAGSVRRSRVVYWEQNFIVSTVNQFYVWGQPGLVEK